MRMFKHRNGIRGSLLNQVTKSGLLIAACVVGMALPGRAATILVEETFSGDGTDDLPGNVVDTYYDAALTASGGSSTWGGALNVETDGLAYGNNAKVTYLNLGSYIDDAKGTANGVFELTATISDHPTQGGGASSYNFLSFANTAAPAPATTTHTIGSIGTTHDGATVAYSFENSLGDLQTKASTIGPHTVTIALDLTATYYNGSTQFGQITLSDSVEGTLGSSILTTDQSFAAISLILDGTFSTRTGVKYGALTLSQTIPEPPKGTVILLQ